MKDRMERLMVLQFSLGCSTQSSVAVASSHQHKKPNQLIKRREDEEASDDSGSLRKEYRKMGYNGANISDGIYKIIRSFKAFSHFFIRYEEERKEKETEMEIGLQTDVKHLSHIGIDGIMTTFMSPPPLFLFIIFIFNFGSFFVNIDL